MERQRQRTLLEWVKDKVESFFAAVSTFVARALLGKIYSRKNIVSCPCRKKQKKMFDNTEKDKGEEAKNKEKDSRKCKRSRTRRATESNQCIAIDEFKKTLFKNYFKTKMSSY